MPTIRLCFAQFFRDGLGERGETHLREPLDRDCGCEMRKSSHREKIIIIY
jgi:hypothetical protein